MDKTESDISRSPTDRDIFKKQLNDEAIRSYIVRETSEKVPEGNITHFTDIIKQDKVSEKIIKETEAEVPAEIIKEIELVDNTSFERNDVENTSFECNAYALSTLINKNIDMFMKDPITYQENFINFYTDFNIITKIKKQKMTQVNIKRLIKAYYFLKYLMGKTHYNIAKKIVAKKYNIDTETLDGFCASISVCKRHGRVKNQ